MRRHLKELIGVIILGIILISGSSQVKATPIPSEDECKAEVDYAVKYFAEDMPYNFSMEKIKDNKIIAEWKYNNIYTTDSDNGDFSNPNIDIKGFEIDISTDDKFSSGKVKTYVADKYRDGDNAYTYGISTSVLGKNGCKLYARIRAYGVIKSIDSKIYGPEETSHTVGEKVYGGYKEVACWEGHVLTSNGEHEMTRYYCEYVKINKANFGSMYPLMKKGYFECDANGKKKYYDMNQDGWLDPSEVHEIYSICNYRYEKSDTDGKYYMQYGDNCCQCKMSELNGLKFLPFVCNIQMVGYSAKTLDLSKYSTINRVDMKRFYISEFKLIAPQARSINIDSESGGSWTGARLTRIDVSKCNSVIELDVGGSYYRYMSVKLPKANKLRHLGISYCKDRGINVNQYKNLYVLELYACDLPKCQVDKCTKLKYAYFYCVDNMTSIDLSKAKGLKGVDVCYCKKLTPATVKTVKGVKITKNQGRWWESTKAGQKLWQEIQAEIMAE